MRSPTYIYALSDEDSAEASGWYLAKVTSILPDGSASLHYHKTRSSETTNLNGIHWFSACGNDKCFLRPEEVVPNQLSVPHKVKGFANYTITNRTITFVELTIPYNSPECLANAKHRKKTKTNYQLALSDLDSRGYPASLITIEIGALGHWLPSTRANLQQLLPGVPKSTVTRLLDQTTAKTIASSHIIFNAGLDDVWNSSRPIL